MQDTSRIDTHGEKPQDSNESLIISIKATAQFRQSWIIMTSHLSTTDFDLNYARALEEHIVNDWRDVYMMSTIHSDNIIGKHPY